MADFPITVFHNPACGTSRNVLALLRDAGHEPRVVEYLKAGWTREQLDELFEACGATPREILRSQGSLAEDLGLLEDGVSDDRLVEAMIAHPVLVNRPIVVTPKGAKLCRPADRVRDLLP